MAVGAGRPSILLTGFSAFPGVEANATQALVPELAAAARRHFPAHAIVAEVLPVEWTLAPQRLQQLLDDSHVQLALHFGVSHAAQGFQIELAGHNVCEARHDAAGSLPGIAHLIADGPAMLASTFPAARIMARLERAGIACSTSDSAGAYLCNALLYHSLAAARERPFLAGFVHLPAGLSPMAGAECALSWSDAIAGGIETIAACLEVETIA